MKRRTPRMHGLLSGPLSASLPNLTLADDVQGQEQVRALQAVLDDLRRTLELVDQTADRVSKMRRPRFGRPGAARAVANLLELTYECVERALYAIRKAEAGGPHFSRWLELSRKFAWQAAMRAGGARALDGLVLKGPRSNSRTARFEQLLAEHPGLSVAKVNAMMHVPLDDATARRIARERRGASRTK